MANAVRINDKVSVVDIQRLSAPLVLDLIEVFKILEQEIILLMNDAAEYTEEELYNKIYELIGE